MAALVSLAVVAAFGNAAAFHGDAKSPDLVIFGMGGSGTRGVKEMMQHLGILTCHAANAAGDNVHTMGSHTYIKDLLLAAEGHVSEMKGYMSSKVFHEAVQAEVTGAQNTLDCVIKDNGLSVEDNATVFKWGYKNPRHLFVLPVVDKAFRGEQKMLAVARDPRDLCSGRNQGQYHLYGDFVKAPTGFEDVRSSERMNTSAFSDEHSALQIRLGIAGDAATWISYKRQNPQWKTHISDCMLFWSHVWSSILQEYKQRENFLVVRIEDLVIHEPTPSSKSYETLRHLMDYVNVSSRADQMLQELSIAHSHTNSYMGHHYNVSQEYVNTLEREVASYNGPVHETMKALGYGVEHYGMVKPTHPRVIFPL